MKNTMPAQNAAYKKTKSLPKYKATLRKNI